MRVDPLDDDVRFDGTRLQPEKSVYVLLNKPKGVVCTNAAHEQKKRVVDLLPTIRGRVFTVGRLGMDSEGLLLVTNDGAFAQEMNPGSRNKPHLGGQLTGLLAAPFKFVGQIVIKKHYCITHRRSVFCAAKA